MNSYQYDHWHILRKKRRIVIEDLTNGKKKEIVLPQKNIVLGKINIPLSNICTMNCVYCSEAESNARKPINTNIETAKEIIDAYFRFIHSKNNIENVRLSFDYGGEPMCMFSTLKELSSYFRIQCDIYKRQGIIQMTTNGVWDTSLVEKLLMAVDEIIFSIDGNSEMHDKYRKYKIKKHSFDLIIENAKKIYAAGKLKQISSVITSDTINKPAEYAKFFVDNFPGTTIKMGPVIITGGAKANEMEKIPFITWLQFVEHIKKLTQNSITILNSKPDKDVFFSYSYGCEHMCMTNWFYWLNDTITCCTDRDNDVYIIGTILGNNVKMNFDLMYLLENKNYIENISECDDCLAKYYCSGGCPTIRGKTINCDRRIDKYAKLLIERTGL